MNRRGFLGSLLGTVAALAITPKLVLPEAEFLALPETAEWQRINPTTPWRMMWKDEVSGLWLQGGALLEAKTEKTVSGIQTSFDFEPITTSGSIYIHPVAIRLFNDQVAEMEVDCPVYGYPLAMCAGDTLRFDGVSIHYT